MAQDLGRAAEGFVRLHAPRFPLRAEQDRTVFRDAEEGGVGLPVGERVRAVFKHADDGRMRAARPPRRGEDEADGREKQQYACRNVGSDAIQPSHLSL